MNNKKPKLSFDERVDAIIKDGLISWINDDIAFVTSQSNPEKGYEVIPLYGHCECKQRELFPSQDCKHLAACKKVKLARIVEAVEVAVAKSVSTTMGGEFNP